MLTKNDYDLPMTEQGKRFKDNPNNSENNLIKRQAVTILGVDGASIQGRLPRKVIQVPIELPADRQLPLAIDLFDAQSHNHFSSLPRSYKFECRG